MPPGVKVEASPGSLVLTFPDEPEVERDLSQLLKTEFLAGPFAHAVARVLASAKAGKSRRTKFKDYKYGYFEFVSKIKNPPQGPADLTKSHVNEFIKWLSAEPSRRTGRKLTLGNRIHKLGCFAAALGKLSRSFQEIEVAKIVPYNPFAGETTERNTTAPLDDVTLRKLVTHVEGQLTPLLDMVDESFQKTKYKNKATTQVAPALPSQAMERFSELLKAHKFLPQKRHLRAELMADGRGLPSSEVVSQMAFLGGPSSRELHLAFEYLLIFTAFNEQPLRDLALRDIEIEVVMGFVRISFASEKLRARATVRRVFVEDPNDVLSVHRVVDAVIRWTSYLRTLAPPDLRDKFLLFLPRDRTPDYRVGSFSNVDKKSEAVVRNCAMALSRDIGDKYIGSRAVRAAGAELLHELTNGDLPVVSLALGQSTIITTNNHYRSKSVRDTEEWKLAGVMLQRERYLVSEGKVDPRNKRGLIESTAATPGWVCLDNLTSPIKGQRRGFPCTAYPMCPKCPHGQPHPDEAYSLARTIQLFAKIEVTITIRGPKAVLALYGDLLPHLEANRNRISDPETIARAAMMNLSPLPDLD